ncbi:PRD domain-containing protein [Enterococcus hulanensis]|uniref:PRD domain-containing protein n=1 Tax=Enterococcus hulanensis TaxID=2559929 RepID=UPI0028928E1C|nr:PRD domain-containing protein [Enterococcus hulanensis]MDT2661690.1 PRD domain-containing protein [Enterococcus hulanensis]
MYKLVKALNNNVARLKDDAENQYIAFGTGIAFQKKVGDTIAEGSIEECYFLGEKDFSQYSDMLESIDPKIIYTSKKIIDYVKKELNADFTTSLFFMLADHIKFSIERFNKNIVFKNPLHYEINRLYPKELKAGIKSLDIILEELDIPFPIEEATMLAMHFVNSQIGTETMQDVVKITSITNDILNIISYHFQIVLDENSVNMNRFLIHLRYFILKHLHESASKDTTFSDIFNVLKNNYPESMKCIKKIDNYLKKMYDWNISENDKIYLALHVNKLITEG